MVKMSRILVIGLDCASPILVFDKFEKDLENLSHLAKNGVYGNLRTCHPPITIPAWMVMCTGVDAGKLGIYGFRYRKPGDYTGIHIISSRSIKERRIWDYLGENGFKSFVMGVPPSYPPYPVNGWMISCFLTPDTSRNPYTYPETLKSEIESLVGRYIIDVEYRREDKEQMLKELYEMTDQHFKVISHMLKTKNWDLFMFVEMGLDRIHHAFWKYFDREHHLYEPGNPFENAILEYYRYIDEKIGEILDVIPKDTIVIVVSDHGVKRMKGAFCINQWLAEKGYLALKEKPEKVIRFEEARIDWEKTIAWGWGGYYARVFINLKGREKKGTVPKSRYEEVREELVNDFKSIKGPNGETWKTKAYRPEELYSECRGYPPDLMVYFDNLYWRSAGTIGHETMYLPENDTGPDDAVHDWNGIFILYDPEERFQGKLDLNIADITPIVLNLMKVKAPENLDGRLPEKLSL